LQGVFEAILSGGMAFAAAIAIVQVGQGCLTRLRGTATVVNRKIQ